ncbi:MAG TPA: TetR family transcriptional regulator [Chloroflexaceae bacterium]|nr:TetR family transcriptional regulator [Chloroflexaceae bacterium]
MAKGEQTRRRIVERAAPVFNTLGYSGTSMSELTRATGLEKGGIYNHFPSKEALALAAFDYAVEVVAARFAAALAGVEGAPARLAAIVQVFAAYLEAPPIAGGCPILNTAVEADDTDQALRARAQEGMTRLQKLIGATVKAGVARGELRPEADPRAVATVITATMEGAIMLGRLYADPAPLRHAVEHLRWYLAQLAVAPLSEAAHDTESRSYDEQR